ncbi:hypothetical protein RJZ56_001906 [Blastomyces dermatitidis]
MSVDTLPQPFNVSDPHARFVSASCLDLLLIELVPMAERLAEELSGVEGKLDEEEHREATFYRLETLGFRGVYVLTDNAFRPLIRMSMSNRNEATAKAQSYLWFPCGIIRGGLASMGITATVQAESSDLPSATFQIKTMQITQPPTQPQQQLQHPKS